MLAHLYFTQTLAAERRRELENTARRFRPRAEIDVPAPAKPQVTIRLARCSDEAGLAQLATLAQRPLPSDDLLVAEVNGELRAALPVTGGDPITDPFVATADLVSLLSLRAAQLQSATGRLEHLRRALRPAI
jgi:hypothetical protein